MTKPSMFLPAFLLLFLSQVHQSHSQLFLGCGALCRFRLCQHIPTPSPLRIGSSVSFAVPNFPVPPIICNADGTSSGKVVTGEPQVLDGLSFVSMFKWNKARPRFLKKFLRARAVPTLGRSAIAHGPPVGNQWQLLGSRCIKLPVVKGLLDGMQVNRTDPRSCVSFRFVNASMTITAFWTGDHDINLAVEEPDAVLSAANPVTRHGQHGGNTNVNACGKVSVGVETAVYPRTFKAGVYCAVLRMRKRCSTKKVKWWIAISINGVREKLMKATGRPSNGETFERVCVAVSPNEETCLV